MTADEAQFAEIFGVSDRFYDYNVPLFKKLKKFLAGAEQHDKEHSVKEEDEMLKQFFDARARYVKLKMSRNLSFFKQRKSRRL